MEESLPWADGLLAVPTAGAARCAVLVLAGSSGRVEVERVRLLAARGAAALSLRWFGGTGQAPGICEIPLETFNPALDRLAALSGRLAIVGTSKGAEAALLLAVRDSRVTAVAALSPSSLVWANVGPGLDGAAYPQRSSWTECGVPLPFVPYDDSWVPARSDRPAYRGLYERSLARFAAEVPAAAIPVERISGRVLVSAGGADQVWPSCWFAERIAERRAQHGLPTTAVVTAGAGHRLRLPDEPPPPPAGPVIAQGGTTAADADHGHRVWTALRDLLQLD